MFGSDIIRVKIKGFLKNITEKENLFFDEKGIINKNKISFISDNIKYNIKYSDSEVIMIRESKDFINTFVFNKKKSSSTYTLKDNDYSIEMDIIVNELIIDNDFINIKYIISDTECEYEYKKKLGVNINDSINRILKEGKNYGKNNYGNGKKVSIEYGTSDGINTIYGDSLSRIMAFNGYDVTREYFVKDGNIDTDKINKNLDKYRVNFDKFVTEESLYDKGIVDNTLNLLQRSNKCYINNNDLWLKTGIKDQLLINSEGIYTSYLIDLSYHINRLNDGNNIIIDIIYKDRKEYIDSIKCGIEIAGYDSNKCRIIKFDSRSTTKDTDINKLRYLLLCDNMDNDINYIEKTYSNICLILRGKDYYINNNYSTIDSDSAYTILNKLISFQNVSNTSSLYKLPNIISNYLYELAYLVNNYKEDNIIDNDKIIFYTIIRIVMDNSANILGLILREEI